MPIHQSPISATSAGNPMLDCSEKQIEAFAFLIDLGGKRARNLPLLFSG
jgi:ribosome biogenesis protein Tsr3